MSDDAGVDDLSSEDVSALKELAEWWRSSKMGRRAVLGASATGMGLAGALGAGVGTAAAQPSGDEGQVGQPGDRVEAWVSEMDADEVLPRLIGTSQHVAAAYSGADADARLGNALSAATDGDTIYLENASYTGSRTVSQDLGLVGSGALFGGTSVDAQWTISGTATYLSNFRFGANATVSGVAVSFEHCGFASGTAVTVSADRVSFVGCDGADVTFEAGTSGGIVDACRQMNVTDNGTNTDGDNA